MKQLAILTLLAALLGTGFSPPVRADWDAKLEAQEEAKRRAAQQEEARKRAEMNRIKKDAEAKAARGYLGKEANGKSDDEVRRLFAERQAAMTRQAANYRDPTPELRKQEADTRKQRDDGMKAMYGKSLKELQGMSDKELEAFSRDVEKKYGK